MPVLLTLITIVFLNPASANTPPSCRWVATFGQSIESVAATVESRSGKKPTVSCGAGDDFKVCHSCSDTLTPEQWRKVQAMLGEPSYNQWHNDWHSFSGTSARERAQQQGVSEADISGEDFFFAHREMFRTVQANLAAQGLPCLTPWQSLPKEDDEKWPTFASLLARGNKEACHALDPTGEIRKKVTQFQERRSKSEGEILDSGTQRIRQLRNDASLRKDPSALFKLEDEVFRNQSVQISANADKLLKEFSLTLTVVDNIKDKCLPPENNFVSSSHQSVDNQASKHARPEELGKITLGALGYKINGSWHGSIHGIYNTVQPASCMNDSSKPECDDMGSARTSHKNIHFYKAHGLIDTYIDRWLKIKGFEFAAVDCKGNPKCYQWKGTFVASPPNFVSGTGCTLGQPPKPAPAITPQLVMPPPKTPSGSIQ